MEEEYIFSAEELKICSTFAENVDTSFYAKRNQFNNEKRKKDSLIGKLGEFAVWNFLKKYYTGIPVDISPPDVKIYSAKEKSWDFDLKTPDMNVHVKSQDIEQGKRYGISWLFQFGDGSKRSYDKEIFDRLSNKQYVAFVTVDLTNNKAILRAFTNLDDLHESKMWKSPKLDKLKVANKIAVYLEDLKILPPKKLNILGCYA